MDQVVHMQQFVACEYMPWHREVLRHLPNERIFPQLTYFCEFKRRLLCYQNQLGSRPAKQEHGWERGASDLSPVTGYGRQSICYIDRRDKIE